MKIDKWTALGLVISGSIVGTLHEHSASSAGGSSADYLFRIVVYCLSYLFSYFLFSRSKKSARLFVIVFLGSCISELVFKVTDFYVNHGSVSGVKGFFSYNRVVSFVVLVPVLSVIVGLLTSLFSSTVNLGIRVFGRRVRGGPDSE